MTRRLFLLIFLLATTAGAYYYCQETTLPPPIQRVSAERILHGTIVQIADDFDDPCQTDPALLEKIAAQKIPFPFKSGGRVAWIGSSSTYIGVWCKTMEFLLRSRHPDLQLEFARHSTGGGTFAIGAERMPDWLERSKPTLIFLNYGCNDAAYGKATLGEFRTGMRDCVERAQARGARVILMTPQSADIRLAGAAPYYRRKHYADEMLQLALDSKWPIIDVHHSLEALQSKGQALNDAFTINWDHIHLTDSGYVAWGFFLYEGLNPPPAVSSLEINAKDGKILEAKNCRATILATGDELVFERTDDILPIIPPFPLPSNNPSRNRLSYASGYAAPTSYAQNSGQSPPPRRVAALESQSHYMLKLTGLAQGKYTLECNNQLVGSATEKEFAAGVNLNTLHLEAGLPPPWKPLAEKLWEGKKISELENRTLIFKLKRE